LRRYGRPLAEAIGALLEHPGGRPDGLALSLVLTTGTGPFVAAGAAEFGCALPEFADALQVRYEQELTGEFSLTGAEAVAWLLRQHGVGTAFAYAGTSELAVCDALARVPGVRLVNGRGDKESAFMAAGASLLRPHRGAAVLHGARGLTNAAGAVADARRNEIATLFVVGLPSTGSAPFLPPHGEDELIPTIGRFVKHWYQVGAVPPDGPGQKAAAVEFVRAIRQALAIGQTRPYGPVILGLPQDVAEQAWIPWPALADPVVSDQRRVAPTDDVERAATLLRGRRVVIIIDDYLLKYDDARPALAEFARRCAAPVLQARYRRGFMLFERLSAADVPSFAGWLDPASPYHRKLLSTADVLVTLEDRNLYPRVVGEFPTRQKLAITSDADKVRKNGYLDTGDLLLEGDVVELVRGVNQLLPPADWAAADQAPADVDWPGSILAGEPALADDGELAPVVAALRTGITDAIAAGLAGRDRPAIVDDSSMFGGLVCSEYDRLPAGVRVFGDHGGFVGGGLAYATGLALGEPAASVLCLLGDQGFSNGLQGLVAAGQERARLVYLVCNNGQAVSLLIQAAASGPRWFDHGQHQHLKNPDTMDYARVAAELGVSTAVVEFPVEAGLAAVQRVVTQFKDQLRLAMDGTGPYLIELRLPSVAAVWKGIWLTQGYEQLQATSMHETSDASRR
jgi:acetolactate synthase-1/2/3 large subunit